MFSSSDDEGLIAAVMDTERSHLARRIAGVADLDKDRLEDDVGRLGDEIHFMAADMGLPKIIQLLNIWKL